MPAALKELMKDRPLVTHCACENRHSSNSMMWLPMNQTRLEKYGTAVLFRMYSNMAGSPTDGTAHYMNHLLLIGGGGGGGGPTFVHVQGERSNSNANHALAVIEELYGFRVEGEIPQVLRGWGINSLACQTSTLPRADCFQYHLLPVDTASDRCWGQVHGLSTRLRPNALGG